MDSPTLPLYVSTVYPELKANPRDRFKASFLYLLFQEKVEKSKETHRILRRIQLLSSRVRPIYLVAIEEMDYTGKQRTA